MVNIHNKIVNELVEEYRHIDEVVAICIFGSVAINKEKPYSDVDIQIVYNDNRNWELFKENRYGINIDFEIVTTSILTMLVKDYPYLSHGLLKYHKILVDKENFMSNIKNELREYYDKHPNIADFWKKEYNKMRKAKEKGIRNRNFIDVCDEAEIKFSDHHSIKRTILTKEFFHKHMK